ncbi:MAG: hypothetical protein FDZ75_04025 [Actinobacteria bacterium]|nr:MAG: hypothetical protein FDZ75_04025 [Actinomycetota bacterium]
MFGPGYGAPFMHHGFGFPLALGGGFMFFGLLFVVGVVVLIVMLAKPGAFGHHGAVAVSAGPVPQAPSVPLASTPVRFDPAEEIVRERFARGEIDNVEFDRIIAALRSR